MDMKYKDSTWEKVKETTGLQTIYKCPQDNMIRKVQLWYSKEKNIYILYTKVICPITLRRNTVTTTFSHMGLCNVTTMFLEMNDYTLDEEYTV